MSKISGKLALVTGATSGIGEATARELGSRGATLVLVGRSEDRLGKIVELMARSGRSVIGIRADLTKVEQVKDLQARVERDLGTPHIIVNSAGAGVWRYLDECDIGDLRGLLESPALAAMLVTRVFLPGMLSRRSGHLVHVTSLAAWYPWPGATAYTISRWAMRGLHESLVADLHGTGVRSTLATFAKVSSTYWQSNAGSEARVPGAQAMIRLLTPDDAARAIVRGIRWNLNHVVAPLELRLILWQAQFFPFFTRQLMQLTGYRRDNRNSHLPAV